MCTSRVYHRRKQKPLLLLIFLIASAILDELVPRKGPRGEDPDSLVFEALF